MTNIVNLVTRLNLAHDRSVSSFPCEGSSVLPVLKILSEAGYISHYTLTGPNRYNVYLDTFGDGPKPRFRLVSSPGKRIYMSFRNIEKKYKNKFVVISTSKQILSNHENNMSLQIGGEVLIEVR